MNSLKKIYKFLLLSLLIYIPRISFAQNPPDPNEFSSGKLTNPIQATNLNAFFQSLISICIQMGTIIAALAIMYGGFLYVTAQGDEEKIGKAYKTLTWSLVGTGVLLGARVIMTAIQGTINQLQ